MNGSDKSSAMTGDRAGLQLRDVMIAQGDAVLLRLDLSIAPGSVVTLMGPSGVGKSSLLAYICGTLAAGGNGISASVATADTTASTRDIYGSGQVILNGRRIDLLPPQDRRVGILFQDDLLFPHMSVGGNLAFALPARIRGKSARMERVEHALEQAGLAGFAGRDPASLSGGQRARVALMRVLLSEPDALLLDEPFSRLDAVLRDQIRGFVFEQAGREHLPTLMVTHDHADALAAGGAIVDLAHDGAGQFD